MGWPKGKPRLKKIEITPTAHEQLIAIYLSKYVCGVPGCDSKMHLEDAQNIMRILKEVE